MHINKLQRIQKGTGLLYKENQNIANRDHLSIIFNTTENETYSINNIQWYNY